MGHINGVFAPDDFAQWPVLDKSNPEVQRDIAALPSYNEMRASRPAKGQHDGHAAKESMDMRSMDMGGSDTTSHAMPEMTRMRQQADTTHN